MSEDNNKKGPPQPPEPQDEDKLIAERRAKLAELRKLGQPFPNDFQRRDLATDLHAAGTGDAIDDVTIRGEVGGVDRDHPSIGAQGARPVDELVDVDGRRVVHDHFPRSSTDQRCEAIPGAFALFDAEDRLEISIEPDMDGDVRTVRINGRGARWHGVLTGAVDRL